ncbi:MAG: DUF1592 domain-containing protein [Luteolibacter sp.]
MSCSLSLTIGSLLAGYVAASGIVLAEEASSSVKAVMPEKHLEVFENYCLDCHDTATRKGKLDLEELSFDISSDIPTAEHWQKILDAVNSGEMPPEDKDQISAEEKTEFLRDLSIQMVTARNVLSDNGGVITMRRLNRRDYQNSLESLLGFRPNVSDIPDDDGSGEFDTYGSSLFFSGDQFELYRATATSALKAALEPREKPSPKKIRVEPENDISKEYFRTAEEIVKVKKRADDFLALPKEDQTEEVAKTYGLKDVEHARKVVSRFAQHYREMGDYVKRPEAKTGAILVHTKNRTPSIPIGKFDGRTGGKYILRVRVGYYEGAPERERYIEHALTGGISGKGGVVLGQTKVTGTVKNPVVIEIPIEHSLGVAGRYAIRCRDYAEKESRKVANDIGRKKNGIGQPASLWVDYVELEGPFYDEWPNPVQATLIPEKNAGEDEASHARRAITEFATRAFRGKTPDSEFMDKLVKRFLYRLDQGDESRNAFIDAYAIILSCPSFLYLNEPREGDKPVQLSDRELAVRLSYFLWSAPPDDELLDLASDGKLSDPQTLWKQTERLLKDPRFEAFVSGFTHQWLKMTRLDMFDFNAAFHPEFDEVVRRSARAEVYANVSYLFKENLPIGSLLKADYAMVNDVLADYYGLPGVSGSEIRKVTLPKDSPRGGLLGTAAISIMGSDGQRSSPVERGAWVLRYLLNDPPPPAPANVPMLARFEGDIFAVRELQKAHQEEPQCAQCHQKIDPIGCGMEHFTAGGLWREVEEVPEPADETAKKKGLPKFHKFPIDPSGNLPSGESFKDYFGLRDAVASRHESFARGFTEHLIAYGLGRPFGISDYNLATDITEKAAKRGDAATIFIHALVQSKQFHLK